MAKQFAAVDVGYSGNEALAAAVIFSRWEQPDADLMITSRIAAIAPYQPGQFYLRELPCILSVIQKLDTLPDLVLVDGYVWLDESFRPGLGAHLHQAFGQRCAVIGVAKRCFFRGNNVAEIIRGRSSKSLFITSVGVDLREAAQGILAMHGRHRIPLLLKKADSLSRGILLG
jgi:deoxyribonuclease V